MITTIVFGVAILVSVAFLIKNTNKNKEILMSLVEKIEDLDAKVSEVVALVASLPTAGAVAEVEKAFADYVAADELEDAEREQALADTKVTLEEKLAVLAEAELKVDAVKAKVESVLPAEEVVAEEPETETPVEEPVDEVPAEPVVDETPADVVVDEPVDVATEDEDEVVLDSEGDEGYTGEPATATDADGNLVV